MRIKLARTEPSAAQTLLDQQLAEQEAFDNAIKGTIEYIKATPGDQLVSSIFKEGTKFVADGIIFHHIGAFFKNAVAKTRGVVFALGSSYKAEEIEALLAQTPEGLKLKVSQEFYNVCKKATEKAASTSMMENEAVKTGAKVEQAAIKNSEQVIAKYESYIQTMRLKIPKLEKYMAEKLAKIKDPVFTKAKLKHIFGVDKLVKERVSGKFDAKYSGYHHDKGWKLVKKGKVKFLSEPQVCPKTGMVYVKQLMIEGIIIEDKTFFPPQWTRKIVIDKIIEACLHVESDVMQGSTRVIEGITKEGMRIRIVISPDKQIISAYPFIK